MTTEASFFLDKAKKLLDEAAIMLSVDLGAAAGRTAYLAAFHAAQALITERVGRSPKTHKGVHARFHELIKDSFHFDHELQAFLSRAYNLKSMADYETGPEAEVPTERARDALATAKRLVASVESMLRQ